MIKRRTPDDDRPRAIVIGLDCIQGLQSARVLSARAIPVIGITKNGSHFSTKTNVCEHIYVTDTGGDKLVDLLEQLGPTFSKKPVLFPCQDKNVLVISEHRSRLEAWYEIVLPPHDVLEMMMNKATFYEHAERTGLPIPETFLIRTREQAQEVASRVTYPCILKPPLRLRTWSRYTKVKGFIAESPSELLDHYDRSRDWTEALIAQRLIPGGDRDHYTCNCYIDRSGEPQVVFTTRKLRQWPPKIGQACLAEEVRNDVVTRETLRVYGSVEYRGLGYLEMKQDATSGEYFIIEPNVGRPTGRSALAEAAGVELLYTMYCDALGLPLPHNRQQKYQGMKWIHLLRDLQAAYFHWRRRELTWREWLRSVMGPKATAVFSWTDPRPFFSAIFGAAATSRSGRERETIKRGG